LPDVLTPPLLSQQAFVKASNSGQSDRFNVVAIDGDTMVVGAVGEGSNATGVGGNQANNGLIDAGAAYVFVRSGDTWTQQAYLKASNTVGGQQFGLAVDVDGDTIVIGTSYESSNATQVNGEDDNDDAPYAAPRGFSSGRMACGPRRPTSRRRTRRQPIGSAGLSR
jgi:hypothetical protein